jgi:hypothetical protein
MTTSSFGEFQCRWVGKVCGGRDMGIPVRYSGQLWRGCAGEDRGWYDAPHEEKHRDRRG